MLKRLNERRILLVQFLLIFCVATVVIDSDRAQAKFEVQDQTGPHSETQSISAPGALATAGSSQK